MLDRIIGPQGGVRHLHLVEKERAVRRHEEILQAAKKYLQPQSLSIVICTDKNEVEAKLQQDFDVVLTEFTE